jgi:hypothetical protein
VCWPAQLSLSILSRKVLQSAVASGTSNPNLEENQGFRPFQLFPQEAPSVWSDTSEPSSGRWNYGREMAEKFSRKWRLPRHFWVLLHAVKHDMGQTALLSLRRKACWGFFRPKNPTASAGYEPTNWVHIYLTIKWPWMWKDPFPSDKILGKINFHYLCRWIFRYISLSQTIFFPLFFMLCDFRFIVVVWWNLHIVTVYCCLVEFAHSYCLLLSGGTCT